MTSWSRLVRKVVVYQHLQGVGKVEGLRLLGILLSFALIGVASVMGCGFGLVGRCGAVVGNRTRQSQRLTLLDNQTFQLLSLS